MVEHNPTPTQEKMDGQHWPTVRELWVRKDKELCESWKDEVQNILIFSGLFSAVVTAFLIESYKNIKPDPTQETVQLLAQLVTHFTAQNVTLAQSERTIDDNLSICINTLWFLSLVLSITTAIIGIVSLQWIRTHMCSLSEGSESLGLSHMLSHGLHRSYIPFIFSSLPVLMIIGLVFFLDGLVIFLFQLKWFVAIPASVAIALTFLFLLTTTVHPWLQRNPSAQSTSKTDYFPSPYRSSQSLICLQLMTFLKKWSMDGWEKDWTTRSRLWFQDRKKRYAQETQALTHLTDKNVEVQPFAYDTIKALVSVKESKSAETEKERTAMAMCLAEALPIHLNLFPTGDLADLVPFLQPSKYVPSAVFMRAESVSQEDLSAVAFLQIATCNGQPLQSPALSEACVRTTCWLFERPRTFESVPTKQPLDLISKPGDLSPSMLEGLINTLTRFFTFAADYHPDKQDLNRTTHTSSYTYWFLNLSANILSKGSLSEEMLARLSYILYVITVRLDEEKEHDYLFLTASIYAAKIISSSSPMLSSPFWAGFLSSLKKYHCKFPGNEPDNRESRLSMRKALKANEVAWPDIDRALEDLKSSSEAALVSDSNGIDDILATHCSHSDIHDQDFLLDKKRELGGRMVNGDLSRSGTSSPAVPEESRTPLTSLDEAGVSHATKIFHTEHIEIVVPPSGV